MIQKDSQKQSHDELFEELYSVLERLITVYRMVLDTVRHERELLIEVDIDELNENNKTKSGALLKLKRLEHERVRIVRLLAERFQLKEEPVTLLQLAGQFRDDRQAEALRQKHSVLDLLIKRVIDNNKQNEELAQSALKNVTGALDAIRDTVQDKPTYAKQGAMKGQGASGQLVRKQV